MNGESLLVVGTVKNAARKLKKNIEAYAKLRRFFTRVEFLLYENNSADGTKDILRQLSLSYPFFHYISEDIPDEQIRNIARAKDPSGRPCRIEIISYARNRLLDRIKERYENFSYILNVDFDAFLFNPADVVKAFEKHRRIDFDCISANGLTKRLRYRDAYAFRNSEFPFGPEFLGEYYWGHTVHQIQKRYPAHMMLSVYSAFGGAALYRTEAYVSSVYSPYPSATFLKIQNTLDISAASPETVKMKSPVPVADTKYDMPIICEHVPFHYGMIEAGYKKQYVNTDWRILFFD